MTTVLLTILLPLSLTAGDLDRARALIDQGRFPEALREMEAAMKGVADAETQYQAAALLREMAGERAARLESLAPDSAEAHALVGRSLESRGKLDDALSAYQAAVGKNSSLPGLHVLIGNILWRKRDFEAAKPEIEAELKLNPHHALANFRMGQILLATNQPNLAAGYLQEAVRANDSVVEAHRALAKAYRALGNDQGALREYRTVLARQPDDESGHYQLAAVYQALGQNSRAKAEMETHRRLLQQKAAAAREAASSAGR